MQELQFLHFHTVSTLNHTKSMRSVIFDKRNAELLNFHAILAAIRQASLKICMS